VLKKTDSSGQKKWRLVIDFRKLNEKTISDRYPIPNIADILDSFGKTKNFTRIDLSSGFHQIEMNPRDANKTAFHKDAFRSQQRTCDIPARYGQRPGRSDRGGWKALYILTILLYFSLHYKAT